MMELLTAAQMRALEAAAIASGRVTGLELMERAGRGVVEAVFGTWPELAAGPFRAVVLCGPGGNGGDGFVVARLLREWGWEVAVFLYGAPERLPPDARVNYERWCGMGEVRGLSNRTLADDAAAHPQTALVVDALFGLGLSRPMVDLGGVQDELNFWQAASRNGTAPRVVAVDVPSGLCADSGRYLGQGGNPADDAILANLTVTFHRAKRGHMLAQGPLGSGRLVVCDIGLPGGGGDVHLVAPGWPGLTKHAGHKYGHGHALVLSGGVGKGGAARLAARGALRIGAGVVTVAVPPAALIENAARLDAVMVRAVGDAAGLATVLQDQRINALCVGPGLGVRRAAELLGAALKVRHECAPYGGVVVDADGLTALAGDAGLFAQLHGGCVLTPHGGEFARLFPDLAAKLAEPALRGPAYSKVDACREAAVRAGCVVLLKGADTVIAAPDGRCSIHSAAYERSAPWLATAGSGDVLAGFICGLLARGFAPMQAAETAAWLHAECARSFGPGLIAEDLPEELPKVFRALGV